MPVQCPQAPELEEMFKSFQDEVRRFERSLDRYRQSEARKQRQTSLHYVYHDCRDPAPPQVDALCSRVTGEIEEVRVDDCSVVLTEPSSFDPAKPLVVKGKPRAIIAQHDDQLWLNDVGAIEEGDVGSQETTYASDREIMQEFIKLWSPRWNKMSHLHDSQCGTKFVALFVALSVRCSGSSRTGMVRRSSEWPKARSQQQVLVLMGFPNWTWLGFLPRVLKR